MATLRGVELLVLDHKQLDHLARNHPELIRRFEEVAHVREEKICQLLVSDLAEWALWIFDVVSETTQNAQYVSGRGVMSDSPLLPQTSSGHGKDIAVPRREFEDMFKSVGVELYDDRVALDLLSRLRAWSKAEGPWKTGPSPGRLGARTDSCPTDYVRRTEVQEWLEELSDSDFFTTAHYCRLQGLPPSWVAMAQRQRQRAAEDYYFAASWRCSGWSGGACCWTGSRCRTFHTSAGNPCRTRGRSGRNIYRINATC